MGQGSIIVVIAAILLGGLLLFSSQQQANEADTALAGYQHNVLARDAAVSGLNLTARKLVADTASWMVNPSMYGFTETPYQSGTFMVKVTAIHDDTVDVRSTGDNGSETHLIEARYVRTYSSLGVPPAFKYAIASNGDLTLNGTLNINALDSTNNANVHTNANLTANGGTLNVEGYGTYTSGTGNVNPDRATDEIFDPNDDTNDEDTNLYEADSVAIPTFDPSAYYNSAARIDTNLAMSGGQVYDLQAMSGGAYGTEENPFIWYIEGDLDITSDVTIQGYGMIVATGDINIHGSVTTCMSGTCDETDATNNLNANDETTLGYYAGGNIEVGGDATIYGHLHANGSVTNSGTATVVGGITAASLDFTANGTVSIKYTSVSKATVIPGFTLIVPDGLRLLAYSEW